MRFVLFICLIVLGSVPAVAQTASETPLACMRAHVIVADAIADRRSLAFSVTNNLDWPLAGIRIGHRVASPDRSVPWVDDSAAIPVPGGIEPGETRTVSISFTPIPPEFPVNDLQIEIDLLDVADAQQRLFLSSVRVTGWSREPSPNTCG